MTRLIDAEVLKKTIESELTNDGYGIRRFTEIIDNAPTVEPFEPDYVGAERFEARQRGYEDGYHNGMEIGKTLNPKIKQGEWVIEHDWVHCSSCGHEQNYPSNFCSKCGADMQKGDAK